MLTVLLKYRSKNERDEEWRYERNYFLFCYKEHLSVVMEYCFIFIKCYVSGEVKKVHMGRLLLCEAVAMILERSFHILGLKPVERM